MAGDEDEPAVVVTGNTSEWLRIRVTEEVGDIFEEDLSYTVTLQSPPGMDYDLYVHQGPQDGPPDCLVSPKKGQAVGSVELVSDEWDDDQGFGGEDDPVWLNIEVRYVAGSECGDAATWTLTIEGHT